MNVTRYAAALTGVAILAWCFARAIPVQAASVEVLSCHAAPQKAHVAIELAGKSAREVTAVLRTRDNRPLQELSIDPSGRIVLPKVEPGTYLVAASAPVNQGGTLCLEISPKKQKQSTRFEIYLHTVPPAPPSVDQLLTTAENDDPVVRLQQFKGVVTDVAKASIIGATAEIRPKGVRGDLQALTAPTDGGGHFSAHLPDGVYTAVFTAQGFRTEVVVFEIGKTGSSEQLQVPLEIADATE